MDEADLKPGPRRSIMHPTDFSAASHTAFSHALRLALGGRTKLTLVHVGRRGEAHWTEYPGIRETLSRWGVIDRNAGRSEVVELGITAAKVHLKGGNKVKEVLRRAVKARADLMVLATNRRPALLRLVWPSVSLAIARSTDVPVLLIPNRVRGFVDRRSGEVTLRRVLLPVAPDVDAAGAIRDTLSLLADLDCSDTTLSFLYVNERTDLDLDLDLDAVPHPIEHLHKEGDVVEVIEREARTGVDLVVMTSLGHDSTQDRVFGSTTERVLERLRVPLLVVPGGR